MEKSSDFTATATSGEASTGHPLPPNALTSLDRVFALARGMRPVVFLDYDGTLSPIVSRPDKAYMSESMRSAVKSVAQKFVTAIVSGRSTQKVIDFVKLDDLFYAGSHGLDISGPSMDEARTKVSLQNRNAENSSTSDSTTTPNENVMAVTRERTVSITSPLQTPPIKHRVAQTFLPVLTSCREQILESLISSFGPESAVEVEDNLLTFSVHYRNAVGCTADDVRAVVDGILLLDEFKDDLICTAGKMVFEIRPRVEWNKGAAVLWLIDTLGLGDAEDIFAIYLGDDVTDEDAFHALLQLEQEGRGCKIASIVVEGNKGRGTGLMTRPTCARFSLRDTHEVQAFLEAFAALDPRVERQVEEV